MISAENYPAVKAAVMEGTGEPAAGVAEKHTMQAAAVVMGPTVHIHIEARTIPLATITINYAWLLLATRFLTTADKSHNSWQLFFTF